MTSTKRSWLVQQSAIVLAVLALSSFTSRRVLTEKLSCYVETCRAHFAHSTVRNNNWRLVSRAASTCVPSRRERAVITM